MTIPNDCAGSTERDATCEPQKYEPEKAVSTGNLVAADRKAEGEDDGFVILDEMPAERQPKIVPSDPKPAPQRWRQYTDDQFAHSCRRKSKTHMWEPIYKDGKETGKWRVYESKGYNWYSFRPSREVPWTALLPSEEAVHEWMNRSLRR